MLRVVLGRARPDKEWSGKVSGLQFSSASEGQESANSRGATSTILTVPSSRHEEEVDLEANENLMPMTKSLDLALGGTTKEKAGI
jgi:hypothetical protein